MPQARLSFGIRQKLIGCFAAINLAFVVAGGFAWLTLRDLRGTVQSTSQTHRVLEQAELMLLAMVNQQSGMRGYLIAGDATFLAPYQAGRADFARSFAEIRQLTAGNEAQQQRLAKLEQEVLGWVTSYGNVITELVAKGDPTALAQAQQMVRSGVDKASMDRVRVQVREIAEVERLELEARSAAQADAFGSADLALLLGIGAALVATVLASIWLNRNVVYRVVRLAGVTRQLANRDYAFDLPCVARTDEIGDLAVIRRGKRTPLAG